MYNRRKKKHQLKLVSLQQNIPPLVYREVRKCKNVKEKFPRSKPRRELRKVKKSIIYS